MNVALVDLSYLFARNWHAQADHEERNTAGQRTLDELSRIDHTSDRTVLCVDTPPYFRSELFPAYKGNRAAPSEEMRAAKRWLFDKMKLAGYTVLGAPGFEADDCIATACQALEAAPEVTAVHIVGCDKDMFQLVRGKVKVLVPAHGERLSQLIGTEEVRQRYNVSPAQMADFQAFMGDTSDNIKGCPGVGVKTAARIINVFGTVDACYEQSKRDDFAGRVGGHKLAQALIDNEQSVRLARRLVVLRTDAPMPPLGELLKGTQAKAVAVQKTDLLPPDDSYDEEEEQEAAPSSAVGLVAVEKREEVPAAQKQSEPVAPAPVVALEPANARRGGEPAPKGAIVPRSELDPSSLEPSDMRQLAWLAQRLEESGLYPKLRWQGILGIALMGRSLGLSLMASLANFSLVEGRPSPNWQVIAAFTRQHPDCEYLRLVESTDERATYETKRRSEPEPTRLTYTLDQAKRAALVRPNSGWVKFPEAMLRKMALVHLSRAVYPDSRASGLYIPEELGAE